LVDWAGRFWNFLTATSLLLFGHEVCSCEGDNSDVVVPGIAVVVVLEDPLFGFEFRS